MELEGAQIDRLERKIAELADGQRQVGRTTERIQRQVSQAAEDARGT